MRPLFRLRHRRTLITGIVLVGVVFRALIPAGFMPSSERPFTLEICPVGLPAQALAHHGHHEHGPDHGSPAGHYQTGHHQNFEHCPFGSAPGGAAPLPKFAALAPFVAAIVTAPRFSFQPRITSTLLVRIHQPRAPPLLDS